jgi:hypothetical protein
MSITITYKCNECSEESDLQIQVCHCCGDGHIEPGAQICCKQCVKCKCGTWVHYEDQLCPNCGEDHGEV